MRGVNGLHHITAIAGPAQQNLDFYAGVLGMRLVKRSVNQDDPGTYHLFYADAEGRPGSDLTFFPWSHMAPPRIGHGLAVEAAPYRPHVTVAREVRRAPRATGSIAAHWPVADFALVVSQTDPAGVRYAVLARWPLAA